MYKYCITLLIIIISVSSCKYDTTRENSMVKQELNSKDFQLPEESVILKYPYRIKKIDSMLLIWDLHGRENFFHVFKLDNKKSDFLFSFGKVGNGPEEFTTCAGMNIRDSTFSVIETNKAVLYTYPIKDLQKRIVKPNRILDLPKELTPIIKFTDMGKAGKIVLDSKGDNRFIILNEKGNIEQKLYKIPNKENENLAAPILQQLWTSCLDYNPSNGILAIATTLGDVVEIYNLKEKSANIKVGKQGEPSIIRRGEQLIISAANGYQDIIVGDNEIYALYSDITLDEIEKNKNAEVQTPSGGNLIYIMDFDGKIKKTFILDRYINGFDIDFEKKIIYGVNSNSNTQLCVFNM